MVMHARPKELSVRIALPGLKSIGSVDLDINPRELTLETEEGSLPEYKLQLRLPYEVDPESDESSAKWIAETQMLFVTIPVVQGVPEEVAKELEYQMKKTEAIEMMPDEEEEEEEAEQLCGLIEEIVTQTPVQEEQKEELPQVQVPVEEEQKEDLPGVSESSIGDVRVPAWRFHDNRMTCTLVLAYAGVAEANVRFGANKEGIGLQFWVDEQLSSLAMGTYAPINPAWSRVKVSKTKLEVIVGKAQPGKWDRPGEVCTLAEAGVSLAGGEETEPAKSGVESNAISSTVQAAECVNPSIPDAFDGPSFIPSGGFAGAKPGYVFGTRGGQTGYYLDRPDMEGHEEEEEDDEEEEKPQTKWDWIQEARSGTSGDSGINLKVDRVDPDPEPQKDRFDKENFKASIREAYKPPPNIETTTESAAPEEEQLKAWSPTHIKIENKLVLELD